MILTHLDFYENKDKETYWEIHNVNLGVFTLVIGLNATGKTRFITVISRLVTMLSKRTPHLSDGNWFVTFRDLKEQKHYEYRLDILNGIVENETLSINHELKLERQGTTGKMFSATSRRMKTFNPPETELTHHVRRDVKEFPFLEDLVGWAANFHGYKFNMANPKRLPFPFDISPSMEDLSATPYLLQAALQDQEAINTIIRDFSDIGYPVEDVTVRTTRLPGGTEAIDIPVAVVKEKNLTCTTSQTEMSQGMYRAFSLVVIVQSLLRLGKACTVAIDDLGEGLDFERSSKITNLLFEKIKASNIQLIVTSNDRFLINSVEVHSINLLERHGSVIESYNYENSKEQFDAFRFTGLNTFDFFSVPGRLCCLS